MTMQFSGLAIRSPSVRARLDSAATREASTPGRLADLAKSCQRSQHLRMGRMKSPCRLLSRASWTTKFSGEATAPAASTFAISSARTRSAPGWANCCSRVLHLPPPVLPIARISASCVSELAADRAGELQARRSADASRRHRRGDRFLSVMTGRPFQSVVQRVE